MKFGFIKVAASTPKVRVADCKFNCENIINDINLAYEKKAGIIVFPSSKSPIEYETSDVVVLSII